MILSEYHNLQISAILVEAAEEQGDKKGLLANVKEFFKKVIDFVVSKAKQFASFITEKARSIFAKIKEFKDRLLKKKGEEKEEGPAVSNQDLYKQSSAKVKYYASEINKLVPLFNDLVKKVELDGYDKRLEKYIETIESKVQSVLEGAESYKELGAKDDVRSTKNEKRTMTLRLNYVLRSLNEIEKAAKDTTVDTKKFVDALKAYKSKLEKARNSFDTTGKYSLLTRLVGRMNSILNKVSGFVSNTWASIVSFLAKLFAGFNKKKDAGSSSNLPAVV